VLDTKSNSFWINKHRIANFDLDISAAHRITGAQALTEPRRAVPQQAETD
jgi:hypothetical protein